MNFVKEGGQEKIVLAGSMHKGMVPSFLLKITQGFFLHSCHSSLGGRAAERIAAQALHSGAVWVRREGSPGDEETQRGRMDWSLEKHQNFVLFKVQWITRRAFN